MVIFKILHYIASFIGVVFLIILVVDVSVGYMRDNRPTSNFRMNLEFFIIGCMFYYIITTLLEKLARFM